MIGAICLSACCKKKLIQSGNVLWQKSVSAKPLRSGKVEQRPKKLCTSLKRPHAALSMRVAFEIWLNALVRSHKPQQRQQWLPQLLRPLQHPPPKSNICDLNLPRWTPREQGMMSFASTESSCQHPTPPSEMQPLRPCKMSAAVTPSQRVALPA